MFFVSRKKLVLTITFVTVTLLVIGNPWRPLRYHGHGDRISIKPNGEENAEAAN
jgi:hypothetical protein